MNAVINADAMVADPELFLEGEVREQDRRGRTANVRVADRDAQMRLTVSSTGCITPRNQSPSNNDTTFNTGPIA